MKLLCIARASAATLVLAGLVGATAAQAAESAAVGHGRQLFMSYDCYECHGTVGQGGPGVTIAPPRLPAQAAFMSFVRRPSPPAMPPYTTKVLSDDDLAAIWTYLNSLAPPAAALPPALARLKQASAQTSN